MDLCASLVKKIAIENGFKNFNITTEKGSDLGFIGILNKYKITENGRELSLFCKFLPENDDYNKKFNSYQLFKREVLVYKDLLPMFEDFQKEYGLNSKEGFWSYPKCYFCNYDEENPKRSLIIMEDLTVENFEVKDKYVPSDYEHTMKLFVELAKFHGISLALKQKKPEFLEKFSGERNLLCNSMQTESMKHIAPRNIQLVLTLFDQDAHKEVIEKLTIYKNDLWKKISKQLDEAAKLPSSVICHGDVWINNVLYNYIDDKKTIIRNIKLVDWQNMHLGSIGAELTYYLYCCVDFRVRETRQEELKKLYYDTLKHFLNKFSINVQDIFSYEMLKKDLSVYGLYAFGMANFAIPLLCKYPEKLFEDEQTNLTNEELQCVDNYSKTMRKIVLEAIDMNIL